MGPPGQVVDLAGLHVPVVRQLQIVDRRGAVRLPPAGLPGRWPPSVPQSHSWWRDRPVDVPQYPTVRICREIGVSRSTGCGSAWRPGRAAPGAGRSFRIHPEWRTYIPPAPRCSSRGGSLCAREIRRHGYGRPRIAESRAAADSLPSVPQSDMETLSHVGLLRSERNSVAKRSNSVAVLQCWGSLLGSSSPATVSDIGRSNQTVPGPGSRKSAYDQHTVFGKLVGLGCQGTSGRLSIVSVKRRHVMKHGGIENRFLGSTGKHGSATSPTMNRRFAARTCRAS